MSGGTYDYAYQRIEKLADAIRTESDGSGAFAPSLRQAFKDHLRLVAKAARAVEWNDSGDGDPDEQNLLTSVLRRDLFLLIYNLMAQSRTLEPGRPIPQDEIVMRDAQKAVSEATGMFRDAT